MFKNQADIVISSNAVFTGLEDYPKQASIAIIGNKITDIGSKEYIDKYIGENTEILEFENNLVIPGFHDFHLHIMSGIVMENGVNLENARSEEEAVLMVKDFAEKHPNEKWITGVGWDSSYWENQKLPSRQSLDNVVPDRLLILNHAEMHYAWTNSHTLEYCNINKDTKNPSYGLIEKDNNQVPTGILYEQAAKLIDKYAYKFSDDKKNKLFKDFLNLSKKFGVTSVNDMYGDGNEKYYDLFREFEKKGDLTTRIHLFPSINFDINKIEKYKNNYSSDKLKFSGLKGFIDGVITSRTAYLTEPYADNPNTQGDLVYSQKELEKKVVEADRNGYRIRFHAIGDGAVRLALDSFEIARNFNGKRDSRHTIEHVEIIEKSDIHRFKELGVLASMQPELMAQSDKDTYISRIGKKKEPFIFPLNTLKKSGAKVGLGTDFRVATLNPLVEIYRAVTRIASDNEPWHSHECISLSEAIKDYTQTPAYGTFRENELGTLEKDKLADIVVLDRNLFDESSEEILETKIKLTIMDGQIVYRY